MSVDFPEHQPGTRPIHTKGIAVAGQFRATRDAKEYCIAPQFDGSWTPVVVRFSNGNGQPDPDGRLQPRGMAVKLYAGGTREPDPGVEHQDQATVAGLRVEEQPIVPAVPAAGSRRPTSSACRRPSSWRRAQNGCSSSRRPTARARCAPPSLLKRLASLARMSPLPPQEAGVTMSGNDGFLDWARRYEPAQGFLLELSLERLPASYARTVYHAVHAFEVEGADGTRRMVRFSFEPSDGVRNEGPPERSSHRSRRSSGRIPINEYGETLDPDYLQAELRERISYAPSRFNLRMQIADPWDDTSDPTKAWPLNRPRVLMGTLFLSHVLTDQIAGCEELSFNPGRLLPGMAPSDDPVLRQRVAVYEESYRRRMEARRQGCPVS